jgi:hypothetical protein
MTKRGNKAPYFCGESDCQKKIQRPAMPQVLVALSNDIRLGQYGQYVNMGNKLIARRSKR